MDCLDDVHVREQSEPLTLSVPQLLRNASASEGTPQTAAINSPDSSIQDLRNRSFDEDSIPPSSESIATSLATNPSQTLGNNPQSLEHSTDSVSSTDFPTVYEIVPPENPLLLARYQKIMLKPGPLSMKRKLVRELQENNKTDSENTLNSEEIAFLERKVAEKCEPLPKIQRRERHVRSFSNTPANSQEITSSESLIPSDELLVKNRTVAPSPHASLTRIVTPTISNTPRMTMQTQSQREESTPQRAQVPSSQGSSRSSSSQSELWQPPYRPATHSNTAAPRRIQDPTVVNLGASGKNPRPNVKNLGG